MIAKITIASAILSTSLLTTAVVATDRGAELTDDSSSTAELHLDVGYELIEGATWIEAQLWGSEGQASTFLYSVGGDSFDPSNATLLGAGTPDERGVAVAAIALPRLDLLPPDLRLHFRAIVQSGGTLIVSDDEELHLNPRFTFDLNPGFSPGGVVNKVGEIVDEQYAYAGIHIQADSHAQGGPDVAVLIAGPMPGGPATDGRLTQGPGGIDPNEHVMRIAIASDDTDVSPQDGYVDVPQSEPAGGSLRFDFDALLDVHELTLMDVPAGETILAEGFDEKGVLVDRLIASGSNTGEPQRVGISMQDLSAFRLTFSATGTLVGANLGGCSQVMDFDTTVTGEPLGLPSGTILLNQLDGVTVSVDNNNASHPDFGILFDSEARTGGDTDLKTPGTGVGNTLPQGLVLVIAENITDGDGDGLVDDPDDELAGGTITFEFDADVTFVAGSVLDVDSDETASFEAFDAGGASLGVFPLSSLGDNSLERVEANVEGARRVELRLSGSGALVSLEYCDSVPVVVADFDGTPRSGQAPLTVQFTDLSSGGPTSWSWDFGDGNTSTAQNPSHVYAATGTYDVSLTATGPGGMDTEAKQGFIVVGDPPVDADFSGTPRSGTAPLQVVFTDLSTGGPTAWSWDFGDGGTSSVQEPTYTYASEGTYTVTLTATGPGGSDTEPKAGYIVVTSAPPDADFMGVPRNGVSPLTVVFSDLSTGAVTNWVWDFGDGGTSTQQNPVYVYNAPGTYDVRLIATGPGGSDTEPKTNYIRVTPPAPPVADFSATGNVGDLDLAVSFTDQSSGGPVTSYLWSFGDGGSSTQQNPVYTYTAAGCYDVSLTVTGPGGSDMETKTRFVMAGPTFQVVYDDWTVTNNCQSCHASDLGGLTIDATPITGIDVSYAELVPNILMESGCTTKFRVVPCDVPSSGLVDAVDTPNVCNLSSASSMQAADLQKIKDWILGGARR